jgi:glycosyltransferase involved in cell wall biosynthesis
MEERYYNWYSPSLRKEMPLSVYGHYGFAILIIPTAAADYLEYKRFSLIDALSPFIDAGKIKVFSINSINMESWMNKQMEGAHKAIRQNEFNSYVFNEVVPFIKNEIESLPIGVDLNIAKPYQSLAEIGIMGNGPFILHVGGFMPEKNHEGLIRIFSKLIKEVPNAKLLLIGEGKLKTVIEATVLQLGLSQNVVFLGRRSDVQQIMPCCQVLVLPSIIEGLPGVILESFVNKLPVVAYNVGGVKEIVIEKKTGWLVEVNEEMVFLNVLKNILLSSNELLTNQAFQLVNHSYRIDGVAKKFENTYRKLILQ